MRDVCGKVWKRKSGSEGRGWDRCWHFGVREIRKIPHLGTKAWTITMITLPGRNVSRNQRKCRDLTPSWYLWNSSTATPDFQPSPLFLISQCNIIIPQTGLD